MSYKVFQPNDAGGKGKSTISIKKSGLNFSRKVTRMYFKEIDFVELYYDEDKKRIALKPSRIKTENCYAVRGNHNNKRVTAKDFLVHCNCSHLIGKKYDTIWNDSLKMLEMQL